MAAQVTGAQVITYLNGVLIPNVQNCEKITILNPKEKHCALNVVDIFKDAGIQPDATTTPLLKTAMSSIFPSPCYTNGVNYGVTKLHIEEDYYMNNSKITGAELRIAALSKKALNDTNLNDEIANYIATDIKGGRIPDFISGSIPPKIFGLNDAAITPNDFSPGIKEIETPGSYIDPGGRNPGDSKWPANEKVLEIDLTNFGFENIIFSSEFINNQRDCIITLRQEGVTLPFMNVTVNRSGKIVDPPGAQLEYFLGNAIKNTFLNNNQADLPNAKNFVLGKELGDTLQVIIGYIMMKADPTKFNENTLAAFTGDIPFACRCMMLNLPVLLRRLKYNSKDSVLRHYSFFTPLELSQDEQLSMLHKAKIDDIIKHNIGVIFRIRRFFAEPTIEEYIGTARAGEEDKIQKRIKSLLDEIIEYIESINNDYLTTEREGTNFGLNFEDYRAFDVCSIIKKTKIKLNPLLTRLMSTDNVSDPITRLLEQYNCKTTGEYYKKINSIIRSDAASALASARASRGATRGATRGGAPSSSRRRQNNPLNEEAEDYSYYMVDILFNYYKYVGGTIIDYKFFDEATQYILNNGLPTLVNFRNAYNVFKKREFDRLPNLDKDYIVGIDGPNIFETNTLYLREQMYNFLVQSEFFKNYLDTIKVRTTGSSIRRLNNTPGKTGKTPRSLSGRSLSRSSVIKYLQSLPKEQLASLQQKYTKKRLSVIPEGSLRMSMGSMGNTTAGGRKVRKHKTHRKHKTIKHKTHRKHKTRKNRK